MTLEGHACAFGAGTIINAIATWKGAAFGIDLKPLQMWNFLKANL